MREPAEPELALSVLIAVLALAGMLFGSVVAAFADNPGYSQGVWTVTKGAALVLLVVSGASFVLLKRGCDELDAPRIARGIAMAGAGFLIAAAIMAVLELGGRPVRGAELAGRLIPAATVASLGLGSWIWVLYRRFSARQPEALPPLPAAPESKRPQPYIPVSVARRSGHAGAVMDADSAEWWRRINGSGSWN